MTNSQRLEAIRAHFRGWLVDHAVDTDARDDKDAHEIVSESLVVRDEFYCGRSFQTTSHRAVWFIEEDELKIHGPDGTVVAVFQGDEISQAVGVESGDTRPDVIKLDTIRPATLDAAEVAEANRRVAEATDEGDDEDLRRAA